MELKRFSGAIIIPLMSPMWLNAVEIEMTPGSLAMHMANLDLSDRELVLKGEADARDFPVLSSLPSQVSRLDMSGLRLVECSMPTSMPGERSFYGAGELADYLFFGSSLEFVSLPSNVTMIPEGAFASSSVVEVVLPSNVHTISAYAFYGCSKLESFSAPSKLARIGDAAFAKCMSLKEVSLPDGVAIEGAEVFAGSGLLSLNVAGAVSYGDYSLSGMNRVKDVTVNPGAVNGVGVLMSNRSLSRVDGSPVNLPALYAAGPNLLDVNGVMKNVESVGEYAFSSSTISNVIFPNSLDYIGDGAFAYCLNLQAIDANLLGKSVPYASEGAFAGIDTENVLVYVADDAYDTWASDPFWSRFEIVAGPSKVNGVEGENGIKITPLQNSIIIESPGLIGDVCIYGISGNVMYSASCADSRMELSTSEWGEKILVVKVSNGSAARVATVMMP